MGRPEASLLAGPNITTSLYETLRRACRGAGGLTKTEKREQREKTEVIDQILADSFGLQEAQSRQKYDFFSAAMEEAHLTLLLSAKFSSCCRTVIFGLLRRSVRANMSLQGERAHE
jgi:hypothetical protein